MDKEFRDAAIYKAVVEGESFTDVGKRVNLSRERIRQIFDKFTKDHNLDVENKDFWLSLGNLCSSLGISRGEIAGKAKCSISTVTGVLGARKQYVSTKRDGRKNAGIARKRIAKAIIDEVILTMETTADALDYLLTFK